MFKLRSSRHSHERRASTAEISREARLIDLNCEFYSVYFLYNLSQPAREPAT